MKETENKIRNTNSQTISDLINYIKCLTTIWKCKNDERNEHQFAFGTCTSFTLWLGDFFFHVLLLHRTSFIMRHSEFEFVRNLQNGNRAVRVASVFFLLFRFSNALKRVRNCPIFTTGNWTSRVDRFSVSHFNS